MALICDVVAVAALVCKKIIFMHRGGDAIQGKAVAMVRELTINTLKNLVFAYQIMLEVDSPILLLSSTLGVYSWTM